MRTPSRNLRSRPVARLDELSHPVHRALFSYWNGLRGTRRLPSYDEIDVLDMPVHILPYVILLEAVGDPPDFRYRLTGTEIDRRNGFVMTGRLLSQLPTGEAAALTREFRRTLVEARPRWIGGGRLPQDPTVHRIERLVLPLSRRREAAELLLGAIIYTVFDGDETS